MSHSQSLCVLPNDLSYDLKSPADKNFIGKLLNLGASTFRVTYEYS